MHLKACLLSLTMLFSVMQDTTSTYKLYLPLCFYATLKAANWRKRKTQRNMASASNLYPVSAVLPMLKWAYSLLGFAQREEQKAAGVSVPCEVAAEGNEPLGFPGICSWQNWVYVRFWVGKETSLPKVRMEKVLWCKPNPVLLIL